MELGIYQHPAAVLAHHDFFSLLDLALLLGRDGIEAAAAGITLHRYHGQAVAVVLADLFVGGQQALVYLGAGAGTDAPGCTTTITDVSLG